MLSRELARTIVGRTMNILGKNINIMDTDGIILASGDSSRVGTFHEGAAKAAKLQQAVEIEQSDVFNMAGVRQGINLPISLNGETVGVVGITGEPSEVKNYGELVRITVELMLEQALFKEQIQMESQAKENLVQDLIAGRFGHKTELFSLRAFTLGFRLDLPRVAVVLDIYRFGSTAENYLSRSNGTDGELYLHRLRRTVTDIIRGVTGSMDITSFVGEDKFVVFKKIDPDKGERLYKKELFRLAEVLQERVWAEVGLKVIVGIGNYYEGLEGLRLSFQEGMSALKLGRLRDSAVYIYHISGLGLEIMLDALPVGVRKAYAAQTLQKLTGTDGYSRELLKTLEVLFANNLSAAAAARDLFLHRNTLRLRLKKIKDITGHDSANFHEAAALYTAFLCWKLD